MSVEPGQATWTEMMIRIGRLDRVAHAKDAKVATGFSSDFRSFAVAKGYGDFDFMDPDKPAFGGALGSGDEITREPIILIHGNGDSAEGWNEIIQAALADGYKPCEIFAFTWGPTNNEKMVYQYHSQSNLTEVRGFIDLVRAYVDHLQADKPAAQRIQKVDIVDHSLGVTLGQAAIHGGKGEDTEAWLMQAFGIDQLAGIKVEPGKYDLGSDLAKQGAVDTYVGMAGANLGLKFPNVVPPTSEAAVLINDASQAMMALLIGFNPLVRAMMPNMSPENGVGRGSACIERMRAAGRPGDHAFSLRATHDPIIDRPTSHVPGEEDSLELDTDHLGLLGSASWPQIFSAINVHKFLS